MLGARVLISDGWKYRIMYNSTNDIDAWRCCSVDEKFCNATVRSMDKDGVTYVTPPYKNHNHPRDHEQPEFEQTERISRNNQTNEVQIISENRLKINGFELISIDRLDDESSRQFICKVHKCSSSVRLKLNQSGSYEATSKIRPHNHTSDNKRLSVYSMSVLTSIPSAVPSVNRGLKYPLLKVESYTYRFCSKINSTLTRWSENDCKIAQNSE